MLLSARGLNSTQEVLTYTAHTVLERAELNTSTSHDSGKRENKKQIEIRLKTYFTCYIFKSHNFTLNFAFRASIVF